MWMGRGGYVATVADQGQLKRADEAEVIQYMWRNQNALWAYNVCQGVHIQAGTFITLVQKYVLLALLFLDQSTIPISCHDN